MCLPRSADLKLLKAKKGKGTVELLEEDDPELLEAEQQRHAEEVLLNKAKESEGARDISKFSAFFEALVAETSDPKDLQTLPKHTRLNNLIHHVSTPEDAEKLPLLIEQWRNKRLPITPYTSSKIVETCCRLGCGEVVYTLLGERQRYGLLPSANDFENTIAVLSNSNLDKAFVTLAMVPLYNLTRTGAMYGSLLNACLATAEDEGLEKAVLTAQDLIDASAEDIENRAGAKSALEKLATKLNENGDQEKVKPIEDFLSSL
ncbi:hypothetical protein BX666DRAFT_1972541 [Dichotomocladium elegans]|nr:hypothetical protein BX666DRAFT_1972541 [Dichotomocladium elegans]